MLAENERTGEINILNFYARRMFRLMPPLFISLAIAYGLTYVGLLAGGITGNGLAAQLFYFANYYGLFFDPGHTIPDGTGILWSLAVEEHFYIFYPLFMTLLLGRALRPRTIGTLLGIGCLVVLAWRIHLVQSPEFVPPDLLCLGHAYRLDYLRMPARGRYKPSAAAPSARNNVRGSLGNIGNRRQALCS